MTRKTLYEEVDVRVTDIDEEQAKELLGWREVDSKETEYLFRDAHGTKIVCDNNTTNRPLYMSNVLGLKQDILHGHWKFNGEPITIGKTGLVLNGQHQLVALVLANQENYTNEGGEPPTIEKLIVLGVEEDDEVVNTMDTAKRRSLADVLYRSYFQDVKASERKQLARHTSFAINTLWERLGAAEAFAPRQTYATAMEFLSLHPKLIECVQHVAVEDGGERIISKYLPLGYAAGMMYLMGCSNSEPNEYRKNPSEAVLDWTNWDDACEFVVHLASGGKPLAHLRKALGAMLQDEEGGSRIERLALVAKGWQQYLRHGKVRQIRLKYVEQDGIRQLAEAPSVGGIDLIEHDSIIS